MATDSIVTGTVYDTWLIGLIHDRVAVVRSVTLIHSLRQMACESRQTSLLVCSSLDTLDNLLLVQSMCSIPLILCPILGRHGVGEA